MTTLNKYMFREYDVRGHETDDELNVDSVTLIAKAYGTFLRSRGIINAVVGHDNRDMSEVFYRTATAALRSTGINVIGIGMSLTPQMYWAQYYFKTEGGLAITASHNPVGWNGMKMALGYSATLDQEQIAGLYTIAESRQFASGEGSFREENIIEAWMKDLLSRVTLHRPLKILLNTANATSSFFSPELFRRFGCEVVEYNTNPDPSYPHYPPNPANIDMITDTGKKTHEVGADVGIGIDADGDRLGVTDEQGSVIWPDRYMILLSRLVLKDHPGANIVFDVKVSESLPEDIAAHGGVPVMCTTGNPYIKRKIKEIGAPFGGEQSGHIFFTDNFYGFDDGNFAGLKLLEYISSLSEPLSRIMESTPYYISTHAMYAMATDARKYEIVEEITKQFKSEGYRVIDINGGRVYMHTGWGLIRATSNLPAVEVRFEAKTQEDLEKIKSAFKEKLAQFPEVSSEWGSA